MHSQRTMDYEKEMSRAEARLLEIVTGMNLYKIFSISYGMFGTGRLINGIEEICKVHKLNMYFWFPKYSDFHLLVVSKYELSKGEIGDLCRSDIVG